MQDTRNASLIHHISTHHNFFSCSSKCVYNRIMNMPVKNFKQKIMLFNQNSLFEPNLVNSGFRSWCQAVQQTQIPRDRMKNFSRVVQIYFSEIHDPESTAVAEQALSTAYSSSRMQLIGKGQFLSQRLKYTGIISPSYFVYYVTCDRTDGENALYILL